MQKRMNNYMNKYAHDVVSLRVLLHPSVLSCVRSSVCLAITVTMTIAHLGIYHVGNCRGN